MNWDQVEAGARIVYVDTNDMYAHLCGRVATIDRVDFGSFRIVWDDTDSSGFIDGRYCRRWWEQEEAFQFELTEIVPEEKAANHVKRQQEKERMADQQRRHEYSMRYL